MLNKRGISAVGDIILKIIIGILILVLFVVLISSTNGSLSGIAVKIRDIFRFGF